tara:strand:- start:859 stop:1578 length:720 start_codon:yes stop_codon:yes gene_type:complete
MVKGNIKKYYKTGISNWRSLIYRNTFPLWLQEFIDCNRQKKIYGKSNILFFHVPKVAGRSFNYMLYKKENSLHITAKNYLKFFSRHLNNNFSFAMMRCPLERIISSFYFLKSGGTKDCRVDYKSIYQSEVFNSFEIFVENYLDKDGDLSLDHVLTPQYHYFSETGNILVDHIGILDRVDLTLNILKKYSNIKLDLPHKNKNNFSPKIELSKKHKEIIERVYAKDFEIYSKLKHDYGFKN